MTQLEDAEVTRSAVRRGLSITAKRVQLDPHTGAGLGWAPMLRMSRIDIPDSKAPIGAEIEVDVLDSEGHTFLHSGVGLSANVSVPQEHAARPDSLPLGTTHTPPREYLKGWRIRIKARPDQSWIAYGPMRTWSGALEVDAVDLIDDGKVAK